MTEHIETREVRAGAYSGWKSTGLSHAVVVSGDGKAVRALCGRVMRRNIAARSLGDAFAEPTCERCKRLLTSYDEPGRQAAPAR